METNNQTIEKRAVKGIVWRYAEEISTKVVSFIVSIILARLLVPEDYSSVSITAIVMGFVDTFIDSGLSLAVIQKGNADKEDYSTVLAFSLSASFLIYGAVFFSAPLISLLYNNNQLTGIIRVLCLLLIINSVKNVFFTRLRTNLQFKQLFFSSFTGTLISAGVGIALAFKGFGAWALVAQQLTDAVIDTTIIIIFNDMKILPHFSVTRFKELFSYSSKILVARLFSKVSNTLSPALISLRYNVLDLTYYTKSKGFSGYMLNFIESPLSQVMLPALSQMKEDSVRLRKLLRKFYKTLYFFTLPALCGLYVVADDLILILLTEKWLPIVPYLKVFIIGMLFNKNLQGIVAIGRSDLYMKAQMYLRIFGIVCLAFALIMYDSPISIAWAYIPTNAIYFFIQVYLERKYLDYKIFDQMKDLLPSLVISLMMAVGVYFLARIPGISECRVLFRLIIQSIFGLLIYLLLYVIYRKINAAFFKKNRESADD